MREDIPRGALLLCSGLVAASVITPASAGPGGHDAVNFSRATYRAREASSTTVEVKRGTHGEGPATVDVTTGGGTATPGSDYQSSTQEMQFVDPVDSDEATIQITNDVATEGLETIGLELENWSRGMVPAFPHEATLTIVDNEGAGRTSFEFTSDEIFETGGLIRVYVLRSGDISEAGSVQYATENGTATSPSDYQTTSGTLQFAANEWQKWVDVPLVNNGTAESNETFTLELDAPSGTTVVQPSTTTITIHDEDTGQTADDIPPYTAFHQPLNGERYTPSELQDLVAFMQDDEDGSGMDRVQLAIRMNRVDGTCKWWNGTRFRPRACNDKKWANTGPGTNTTVDYFTETVLFSLDRQLASSSTGSPIRDYTAYCRGWDNAGNVQTKFDTGQNRNTFEVN